MTVTKYVSAGELCTAREEGLLCSTPLGSCIALIAYDPVAKAGGMAHIMLPGKSPKNGVLNKYAENAIPALLDAMFLHGANKKNIRIGIIGGANVLQKKDDSLVESIINSVIKTIEDLKIPIIASSLGGHERRSASLNISRGELFYTIGDSKNILLCAFFEQID